MALNRAHGQHKLVGDLFVRQAGSNQAEDFKLALAKRLDEFGGGQSDPMGRRMALGEVAIRH
jgi:hypothetical protein